MENSVTTYTVQELVDLGFLAKPLDGNHGGIHPKSSDFVESGIPFVMASDLKNGEVDTHNCKFISLEQSKTLRKGFAKEGDILLSHKATIGRTAIVGEVESEYIVLTPQVTYYRVLDKTKINPKYLKYYFDSIEFQSLFEQWAGGGSTRLYLGITGQMKLPIKLPHINTQNWIAANIDSFDLKLLLNRQTNQTLERMAQALFKSWFVDFDPVFDNALANGVAVSDFPEALQKKALSRQQQRQQEPSAGQEQQQSANGEPSADKKDEATPLPEDIQQLFTREFEQTNEPSIGISGWIPKGWKVSKFKEAIDQYIDNRGKTPPLCKEGIPLIEVKHLPENTNFPVLNSEKKVTEDTFKTWFRKHVEEKDILISTVGTIGRTAFVKNTRLGIAQNVLGLRFRKIVNPEYMFYTIKGHKFQHDVDARLVTTVQASIKRKDLDTIDILVPSHCIQNKFSELVGTYIDTQYCKFQAISGLELIRDTLLPKLISGELTLPADNIKCTAATEAYSL
ncbi:restriction endonuclease subunit S [Psychrobium sp. nBUS_13]|uniref:restriction endonuclease subunit S n=1 Tax=Psychrobium sp. nBUS_13 TaxID=3395319 RepID=UPI003EBD48CF